MIPAGRSIPLGSVQFAAQHSATGQRAVVRLRQRRNHSLPLYAGHRVFYGPPEAAQAIPQNGRPAPAVRPENAFLNPNAGWRGAATIGLVVPGDTYDVINQRPTARAGPDLRSA